LQPESDPTGLLWCASNVGNGAQRPVPTARAEWLVSVLKAVGGCRPAAPGGSPLDDGRLAAAGIICTGTRQGVSLQFAAVIRRLADRSHLNCRRRLSSVRRVGGVELLGHRLRNPRPLRKPRIVRRSRHEPTLGVTLARHVSSPASVAARASAWAWGCAWISAVSMSTGREAPEPKTGKISETVRENLPTNSITGHRGGPAEFRKAGRIGSGDTPTVPGWGRSDGQGHPHPGWPYRPTSSLPLTVLR
jgi:hypothetical protein